MVKLNKKGAFTDMFLFIILAFIIVVICGVFIYMGNITKDKLHETMDDMVFADNVNTSEVIEDTFGDVTASYNALYWIAILLIVGMIISIFIGSYLVTTKSVFMLPYLFILILAIVFAVVISNAYELIITQATELAPTLLNFVGANFILAKLPVWVTLIGLVGAIIMFSRMGSKEQQVYYG